MKANTRSPLKDTPLRNAGQSLLWCGIPDETRAGIPQPPSLRGGVADAAIQFHSLTTGAPHPPSENQNLWIATSATPPRNDVHAAVALNSRRDFQHAGQPLETMSPLAFLCSLLREKLHEKNAGNCLETSWKHQASWRSVFS